MQDRPARLDLRQDSTDMASGTTPLILPPPSPKIREEAESSSTRLLKLLQLLFSLALAVPFPISRVRMVWGDTGIVTT